MSVEKKKNRAGKKLLLRKKEQARMEQERVEVEKKTEETGIPKSHK